MGHGPLVDKNLLIEEIYKNDGVVAWTARSMGIAESTIWNFSFRDKDVNEAIDDARAKKRIKYKDMDETLLNEAYHSLTYLLKSNDTTATIFTMKTQGKYREADKNTGSGSLTVNTIDYSKAT